MPLILAVDDEHSGLYRKLILQHAGYTVLSATGVAEALHLFHGNPVDLVLTDQLLGRQVGTEMAEMAREMKRTKPCVPVLLLSGTGNVPEPLVDVDAFLSKNEGPEQLLGLIKQLLGSGREPANSQLCVVEILLHHCKHCLRQSSKIPRTRS